MLRVTFAFVVVAGVHSTGAAQSIELRESIDLRVRIDTPRALEVEVSAESTPEAQPSLEAETSPERVVESEVAPRHKPLRLRSVRRSRVGIPRLSIGIGIGIDGHRWLVGDVVRSGVAGPELMLRIRVASRQVLTLRTATRQLGVGWEETSIPVSLGWQHSVERGGTGHLYLGGELTSFLDLGANRAVAVDWGGTARLGLAGHLRALRMGVYVEFHATMRVSFAEDALALGGGMTVGFTADAW